MSRAFDASSVPTSQAPPLADGRPVNPSSLITCLVLALVNIDDTCIPRGVGRRSLISAAGRSCRGA